MTRRFDSGPGMLGAASAARLPSRVVGDLEQCAIRGGIINHIELGEDVNKSTGSDDPDVRNFPFVQSWST